MHIISLFNVFLCFYFLISTQILKKERGYDIRLILSFEADMYIIDTHIYTLPLCK